VTAVPAVALLAGIAGVPAEVLEDHEVGAYFADLADAMNQLGAGDPALDAADEPFDPAWPEDAPAEGPSQP
jgi:hypothetical protein